jgi:hypothetical protein
LLQQRRLQGRPQRLYGKAPAAFRWALIVEADIDAVGDQHPDERVVQNCLRSIDWHSRTDGRVAGRAIGQCFSRGGNQQGQGASVVVRAKLWQNRQANSPFWKARYRFRENDKPTPKTTVSIMKVLAGHAPLG